MEAKAGNLESLVLIGELSEPSKSHPNEKKLKFEILFFVGEFYLTTREVNVIYFI